MTDTTTTNESRTALNQESEPIALAHVETELHHRIRAMQTSPHEMILPARMSNLVIFSDRQELTEEITEMIADIIALHPARIILLEALPSEKPDQILTTVTVRAHAMKNDRGLVTEQITIRAKGNSVQQLPYLVMSLVVGDLPINLWWASSQPPPMGGVLFHELSENVEQTVFDSVGWQAPAQGVVAMAAWIQQLEKTPRSQRWCLAADLNWRRLKYWRRLLSQALDPATAPGFLDNVSEVIVEHGPHAVVQAWELVSWLASRLGWSVQAGHLEPGVELSWQFMAAHGPVRVRVERWDDGRPKIYRMLFTSGEEKLSFVVGSERRLAAIHESRGAMPRTMTVQSPSQAELVARQLSDRDRDPVFRASLEVARVLAQSVLH